MAIIIKRRNIAMRVLEAISDTNIGGAGRLLLTRLGKSDRSRIDTAVVLPRTGKLLPRFAELGVRCYTIDGCEDKSFDLGAVGEICRVIKEYKPDIVNAHGCMSARLAAYFCGVPIRIFTRHCAFEISTLMRSFPARLCVGGFNRVVSTDIIAVADAAADNLASMGIPRRMISVIINGVDGFRKYTEEERKICRERFGLSGCFVVGICARLEECKDHVTFLRAARILAKRDERYRFMVIGDGSQRKPLLELCEALGIRDKVIFTGFTDDVEMYYNCLDINVNCSVGTETSSLALSEGMSLGLPSVASSFGGNPYMVRHGENGFIYETGDFFGLASRISEIAEDCELYHRMSRNALERFRTELNSRKMTDETERLYQRLYEKKEESKKGTVSSELR